MSVPPLAQPLALPYEANFFEKAGPDVVILIMQMLSPRDLCRVHAVHRVFRDAAVSGPRVWDPLHRLRFAKRARTLHARIRRYQLFHAGASEIETSRHALDHIPRLESVGTKSLWRDEWNRVRTERHQERGYRAADKCICIVSWLDSPLVLFVCLALLDIALWTSSATTPSIRWPWISFMSVFTAWIGVAYGMRSWRHATPCCVRVWPTSFVPHAEMRDKSLLGRCLVAISLNNVGLMHIHAVMVACGLTTCWLLALQAPISLYWIFAPLLAAVAFGTLVLPCLPISRLSTSHHLALYLRRTALRCRPPSSALVLGGEQQVGEGARWRSPIVYDDDGYDESSPEYDGAAAAAAGDLAPPMVAVAVEEVDEIGEGAANDTTPLDCNFVTWAVCLRLLVVGVFLPLVLLLVVRAETTGNPPLLVFGFIPIWIVEFYTLVLLASLLIESRLFDVLLFFFASISLVAAQILLVLCVDFSLVPLSAAIANASLFLVLLFCFVIRHANLHYYDAKTMHPRILLQPSEPTWTVREVMQRDPIWI